ncbi:unnamed protein product [Echinostoma caproni]|uniref:Uncharacterized protein n=1 Tax=Echinostoma caproni TaxID=27848 RepID=A0A183B593_9TREM|nr:unnamed protein product [Echinostoma caproni]
MFKIHLQLICRTTDEMRSVRAQLENACPDSLKLADILNRNTDATSNPELVKPSSPPIMDRLQRLVQDDVTSAEDEQVKFTGSPLVNGLTHITPTPSPNQISRGPDGLNDHAQTSSPIELKPEPDHTENLEDAPSPEEYALSLI